ncbi:MAG: hypothetical protein KC777_19965 [Cyanobacteria bacterium HKST-UBA02]|nr:hypothetical protein [Cyanobacteria bacterium HKST-UBA02]
MDKDLYSAPEKTELWKSSQAEVAQVCRERLSSDVPLSQREDLSPPLQDPNLCSRDSHEAVMNVFSYNRMLLERSQKDEGSGIADFIRSIW